MTKKIKSVTWPFKFKSKAKREDAVFPATVIVAGRAVWAKPKLTPVKPKIKVTRTRASYKIRTDTHAVNKSESMFRKFGEDKIVWEIGAEVITHKWDDKKLEWVRG